MAEILEAVSGTLATATYPNRWNVVIPTQAPFARTGLELTDTATARVLIEGLDYYLGYYFEAASVAIGEAIYGGIVLLNSTSVDYVINPIDREYRIPASEIGKWLVATDLKDPRNVGWDALMRYAPTIAPIDPPTSLPEAAKRDDIVAALNSLADTVYARASAMESAFDALRTKIIETGAKLAADGHFTHHAMPDQHHYTAADIGALEVGATAVDTVKAYGRSLDQLAETMRSSGINETHIATLMERTLGDLRGRLRVINNNTLEFRNAANTNVIRIHGNQIDYVVKTTFEAQSDRLATGSGAATEMQAGINQLLVQYGETVKAPVYNGSFLVTPDQVGDYLYGTISMAANAYFTNTDTVSFVGSAKDTFPLQGTVTPPAATKVKVGLVKITSTALSVELDGTALSQKGITDVYDQIELYVSDTFTINGQTFNPTTQELTVTAASVDVDKMDNTAPANKPVSKALINALALKSLLNHTHTLSDITGSPAATGTTAGLLQLHDAIDSSTTTAVTARQGWLLDAILDELEGKSGSLLPSWSIAPAIQYGPVTPVWDSVNKQLTVYSTVAIYHDTAGSVPTAVLKPASTKKGAAYYVVLKRSGSSLALSLVDIASFTLDDGAWVGYFEFEQDDVISLVTPQFMALTYGRLLDLVVHEADTTAHHSSKGYAKASMATPAQAMRFLPRLKTTDTSYTPYYYATPESVAVNITSYHNRTGKAGPGSFHVLVADMPTADNWDPPDYSGTTVVVGSAVDPDTLAPLDMVCSSIHTAGTKYHLTGSFTVGEHGQVEVRSMTSLPNATITLDGFTKTLTSPVDGVTVNSFTGLTAGALYSYKVEVTEDGSGTGLSLIIDDINFVIENHEDENAVTTMTRTELFRYSAGQTITYTTGSMIDPAKDFAKVVKVTSPLFDSKSKPSVVSFDDGVKLPFKYYDPGSGYVLLVAVQFNLAAGVEYECDEFHVNLEAIYK